MEKIVDGNLIESHTYKENFPVSDYRYAISLEVRCNMKRIHTVDVLKVTVVLRNEKSLVKSF